MYVNHPSLTQSVHWISFSAVLHRACDWFTGTFSLKLEWHTMLVCVEAHTHTSTHAHTHTYVHIACLYATALGFLCQGGRVGGHAANEDPFEISSRSPCPAGCANICSEWPQDWHERGLSTLLDLGSAAAVLGKKWLLQQTDYSVDDAYMWCSAPS